MIGIRGTEGTRVEPARVPLQKAVTPLPTPRGGVLRRQTLEIRKAGVGTGGAGHG